MLDGLQRVLAFVQFQSGCNVDNALIPGSVTNNYYANDDFVMF